MSGYASVDTLRIGLVGSGFIANFHLQALVAVRHVAVTGIFSPTVAHREALAAKAIAERDGHRALGLGLADDVLVELGHDLAWRERLGGGELDLGQRYRRHQITSIVSSVLV